MVFSALQKYVLVLFVLVLPQFLGAQSAGSKIWYFGNNAGVDFTQTPPVALTDGKVYTDEGCAAVSDPKGKLFFYTDGRVVYNRTHNQMTNGSGLNGDPSSTQSAVAVADPSNINKYYLFTVDAFGGAKGLCYSVIDMSQSGGLGSVTVKNKSLKTPVSEKITAIRKPYSNVVWVISRGWDNDSFHIFKLDSFGCKFYSSQSIGTKITGGTANTAGYLKSNIQGTKVAYATYQGFAELFDFDPVKGVFSNPIKFNGLGNAYGVEFSKSGALLYICSPSSKKIMQADVEAGSSAAVLASLASVVNISGNNAFGLQMGPDGRIYMAIPGSDYISCIPNPEIKGTGCGYIQKAVDLSGKLCRAGLPNALNSDLFEPVTNFTYRVDCVGEAVKFTDTFDFTLDSLRWYFGWNGTKAIGTSTQSKPIFTFPKPGNYGVKLVAYRKDVRVDSVLHIITLPDTLRDTVQNVLCFGDSLKVGNTFAKTAGLHRERLTSFKGCDSFLYHNIQYLAQKSKQSSLYICDGTTYDFYGQTLSTKGIYTKKLTGTMGCDSSITLDLNFYPKNETQIQGQFCSGSGYDFNGKNYATPGSYPFHFTAANGCDSLIILTLIKNTEIQHHVFDTFCLRDSFIFYGLELRFPGNYRKVFQSPSGCDSAVILHLSWRDCHPSPPCYLEFPNAFSPDQNKINDVFKPIAICFVIQYRLRIYDRWGQEVFSSDNPDVGWDGTYMGNPVPTGVYAWLCNVTAQQSIDPEKHHFEGTVTVFR